MTWPVLKGRTGGSPRIAYEVCGQGEELVCFLHGIGGNKSNWSDQLAYFADRGMTALAWDVRGYGESDDFEGAFDFAEISADLLRLLDHRGADSAHFVGLSMGGRILMDFGHRHPERVRSLTICAAFPSFGKALDPAQREQYLRLRREPLLSGLTFTDLADSLIQSLAGPNLDEHVHARLLESICALRKPSYLKALEAAVYFDRIREIQEIRSRTLLLYADGDRLTPPHMGREVAAMMPQAEFHVLSECGHLMNLECPDVFNRIVFEFIQGGQRNTPAVHDTPSAA